jgi:hypothetical protein
LAVNPAYFVDRWLSTTGGAERANYQLFLSELTGALGVPPPEPAEEGRNYRFEFPVRGDAGQPLRIDLYKRDCFILEAKQSRLRPDKNEARTADLFEGAAAGVGHNSGDRRLDRQPDPFLRPAFNQAWDYANRLPAGHERPPFIVTCDVGRRFELYADFSGQGRDYRPWSTRRVILLEDLLEPAPRDELIRVWTEPAALNPALRRAEVTREVAAHVAELSRSLEADGRPAEEVATFLARCLFACFAQTVGLLPEGSVTAMLRRCLESPDTFMGQATDLFARMDEGGFSAGLNASLVRFNGAFFKDRRAFPLKREQIGVLIEAAGKDWRSVEPAIFGTLLEQALSRAERSRLGAHYTPRPYVETLVTATVMEPLRAEWEAARAASADLRARGDADGARLEVAAFHERLAHTRVLDPACGTGNFLYVALERMKALEAEVLSELDALGVQGALRLERLDPRTFLGIEVNPRAAAIAELVLWIGYLQAVWRHGDPASTPVLRDYGNVRRMDAVLSPGGGRPEWPEAEYIVGNPPFIGGKDIRAELGGDYAQRLWKAHPQMNDSADLVMYWWDRAAEILTRKGTAVEALWSGHDQQRHPGVPAAHPGAAAGGQSAGVAAVRSR